MGDQGLVEQVGSTAIDLNTYLAIILILLVIYFWTSTG